MRPSSGSNASPAMDTSHHVVKGFQLGTESTYIHGVNSCRQPSSLTLDMSHNSSMKNNISFKQEVSTRTCHDMASGSDAAIESDSEDGVEDSEGGDWEDEVHQKEGRPFSPKDGSMFRYVEPKSNLSSHRSLLTTVLHEGGRAKAPQNEVLRSASAVRRSRSTTQIGNFNGHSPQKGVPMVRQAARNKPIVQITPNNNFPTPMSPRTTRRRMMQFELPR